MTTKLIVVRDGRSTPTWARRISDETGGYYTQAAITYSVNVPEDAQVVIFGVSGSFIVSDSTFTPPTSPGESIPTGALVNPGALWVEDIDTLYFSTLDETLVNLEFYKIGTKATGEGG